MTKRELLEALEKIINPFFQGRDKLNLDDTEDRLLGMRDNLIADIDAENQAMLHGPTVRVHEPMKFISTVPAYYALWDGSGWVIGSGGRVMAYLSPAPLFAEIFADEWNRHMIDTRVYRVAEIPPDGGEPTQFIERPARAPSAPADLAP